MWVGAEPPTEYVKYVLCRYILPGCLPSQLDREDPEELRKLLLCAEMDARLHAKP